MIMGSGPRLIHHQTRNRKINDAMLHDGEPLTSEASPKVTVLRAPALLLRPAGRKRAKAVMTPPPRGP